MAGCDRTSPGPFGSSSASGVPRQPATPSSTAAGGPSSSAHPRRHAAVPAPTVTAGRTTTLRALAHALPFAFSAVEFLNARRLAGRRRSRRGDGRRRAAVLLAPVAGSSGGQPELRQPSDRLARRPDGGLPIAPDPGRRLRRHPGAHHRWREALVGPEVDALCPKPGLRRTDGPVHGAPPQLGDRRLQCRRGRGASLPASDDDRRRVGGVWTTPALPSGFAATDLAVVSAHDVWLAGIQCGASAQGLGRCPTALEHTADGGRTWSSPGLPGKLAGGGPRSFATAAGGCNPSPAAYCAMAGCWVAPPTGPAPGAGCRVPTGAPAFRVNPSL